MTKLVMYWVDYDLNFEWVRLRPIRGYKTPGSSCWNLLNGATRAMRLEVGGESIRKMHAAK